MNLRLRQNELLLGFAIHHRCESHDYLRNGGCDRLIIDQIPGNRFMTNAKHQLIHAHDYR